MIYHASNTLTIVDFVAIEAAAEAQRMKSRRVNAVPVDEQTSETMRLYRELTPRQKTIVGTLVYILSDKRKSYTRPLSHGLTYQQLDLAALVKTMSEDERARFAPLVDDVSGQLAEHGFMLDGYEPPAIPYRVQLSMKSARRYIRKGA